MDVKLLNKMTAFMSVGRQTGGADVARNFVFGFRRRSESLSSRAGGGGWSTLDLKIILPFSQRVRVTQPLPYVAYGTPMSSITDLKLID